MPLHPDENSPEKINDKQMEEFPRKIERIAVFHCLEFGCVIDLGVKDSATAILFFRICVADECSIEGFFTLEFWMGIQNDFPHPPLGANSTDARLESPRQDTRWAEANWGEIVKNHQSRNGQWPKKRERWAPNGNCNCGGNWIKCNLLWSQANRWSLAKWQMLLESNTNCDDFS